MSYSFTEDMWCETSSHWAAGRHTVGYGQSMCGHNQSKLYSTLLKLEADMAFSPCPSSIGRLLDALRCLSVGPLFACGDADADGVLSGKADMHAN